MISALASSGSTTTDCASENLVVVEMLDGKEPAVIDRASLIPVGDFLYTAKIKNSAILIYHDVKKQVFKEYKK